MDDLIEALQIMRAKAGEDVKFPTHCEHDELRVYPGVEKDAWTEEELKKLDDLGFMWDEEFDEGFLSFRFGSC